MNSVATPQILMEDLPAIEDLERLWLSLESKADSSFFISWGWIGTWVMSLPDQYRPRLLRVTQGENLIGLALLVDHQYRRHHFIPVTETHLNETGSPYYDSLTIEYNDILWDRSVASDTKHATMVRIINLHTREEFHAAGVAPDSYWTYKLPEKIHFSVISKECNGVDLEEVRANGDYLRLISANTRSKIRKAFSAVQQIAEVRVTAASDVQTAETMYGSLVQLHQQTWLSRGKPGAFANRYVYDFHLQLIRNRLVCGEIQLLSVHCGEKLMGVLYNFIYRGRVYNYQSGIDYTGGNDRFKPGLLIHSLAIDLCAKAGFAYYDLMAGDTQYKRSLGTRSNHLNWLIFQKPKLKFRLENQLRQWKQSIFKPATS